MALVAYSCTLIPHFKSHNDRSCHSRLRRVHGLPFQLSRSICVGDAVEPPEEEERDICEEPPVFGDAEMK